MADTDRSRPATPKSISSDRIPPTEPPKSQSNTRPTTAKRPTTSRGPITSDVKVTSRPGSAIPPSRPRTAKMEMESPRASRPATAKTDSRPSTAKADPDVPRRPTTSKDPESPRTRPTAKSDTDAPSRRPTSSKDPESPRSARPAVKPDTEPTRRPVSVKDPESPRASSRPSTPTLLSRTTSAVTVKSVKADQEAATSRPVTAKNGMRSGSARVLKTLEAAATAGKVGVASKSPSRQNLGEGLIKTMPKSGGWVGWFSNSDSEMTKIFFEVAIEIDGAGNLSGGPREESSPFLCQGTVSKNEPHMVSFVETERFGHDIKFEGVFVEKAIAGRWHKSSGGEPRGRLCIFRISDPEPNWKKTLRPGRWAGCCWSEREKDWLQVSFAWLDVRGGIVYGKDELTDDNVFITTRGSFDESTGRIRILVTEWFEQDSSFRVYSGVLAKDGHIRGLWTSSEERDMDEDEESIFDVVPEDDDEATLRIWRVDGDDAIEWLPETGHPILSPRLPEGKWKGTWTYDGGVQSTDHCTWNLRFLAKNNRIQGDGISILDSLEEEFVCDGTYDAEKNTIKLYQSYLTTLSVYVYDLRFGENGALIGKGSSKDDSDGLVVDFKLTRM